MKENLTIPNLLSIVRIVIIPFFAVQYLAGRYQEAIILLALSGVSDVLDGFIARRFHQISTLGKMLDPFADKLTQAVVVVCLTTKHTYLMPLAVLFFAKELLTVVGTLMLFRHKKRPTEARWWGKLATAVIYGTMLLVILSDLYPVIPDTAGVIMMIFALACVIFAFFNYAVVFFKIKNPE